MPLTKEQWAAAKNALPILGQMLKDKNAVLAETEGNLWRLGEKLANTPNVPVDPQKIAALLYSIVLADVNGVINGVPGSGQLFWSQKPPKLLAFEKSRGVGKLATHLPEKRCQGPNAHCFQSPNDCEWRWQSVAPPWQN